ncbi:Sister chromatid cohesion protein PDS5 -like protein B [Trichinella pseudospiralis]|uniref:Sister chromatid cohesion protein PDS5-like protein B n=1 Tax=Trichinella pseudospiralis TaxID=6337 RepID=A0A0V0YC91_TRIPS|nr:Sister chromatid cohesion protein PDS5 -like protein B [Trichinella pseudospiralis]
MSSKNVIYPENCSPLTANLSSNDLVKRLKVLSNALGKLTQEEAADTDYRKLAMFLKSLELMNHKSKEVKVFLACCFVELFRLYVPAGPFEDSSDVFDVQSFLLDELKAIATAKNHLFGHYYYILETISNIKVFNLLIDMPNASEMALKLFKALFFIARAKDDEKIVNLTTEIIDSLLQEMDYLPEECLDFLMEHLVEPLKSEEVNAYNFAKKILIKSENYIKASLSTALGSALLEEECAYHFILKHCCSIIVELYRVNPVFVMNIVPMLEIKFKSVEESERLNGIRFYEKLATDSDFNVIDDHPLLWKQFVARFSDISANVRLGCAKVVGEILAIHPELTDELTEVLVMRSRDTDESVRLEILNIILKVIKNHTKNLNNELLNSVRARTLDKKFKVRKEALRCLGALNQKIVSGKLEGITENLNTTSICSKLLHTYYSTNFDDRILCEKLFYTSIVPFKLPCEQRMNILLNVYATLDEPAVKCFNEIIKQQDSTRLLMRSIINLDKGVDDSSRFNKLLVKIKQLSETFTNSLKVTEHLKQFFSCLQKDKRMLNLVESLIDMKYKTNEIEPVVKEIMSRLAKERKDILSVARLLLERASPVLLDTDALDVLFELVESVVLGTQSLEGISEDHYRSRSLDLLLLLSCAYSQVFSTETSLQILISFLKEQSEEAVVEIALQIIANVAANFRTHPRLQGLLISILKKLIEKGPMKQAKHAVKCFHKLCGEDNRSSFAAMFHGLKVRALEQETGLATILTSLGCIATCCPNIFYDDVKCVIDHLRNALFTSTAESSFDDSLQTKIAFVQLIVRWLVSSTSADCAEVQNCIQFLMSLVTMANETRNELNLKKDVASAMKVAAGCGMLKLLQLKIFRQLLTVEQYREIAFLTFDSSDIVREKFLTKLQKYVKDLKLSIKFMAFYPLISLVSSGNKKVLDKQMKMLSQSLLFNIHRRRQFVRCNPAVQADRAILLEYLPEYYICYVIYLLSYWPGYRKHDDIKALTILRKCLWFAIEPLTVKKEGDEFNYDFLFYLLIDLKHTKLQNELENTQQNEKFWALCDLALLVLNVSPHDILKKATSARQKNVLPTRFFNVSFKMSSNISSYLPVEMQLRQGKQKVRHVGSVSSSTSILRNQSKELSKNDDLEDSSLDESKLAENDESKLPVEQMTANGPASPALETVRKRGRPRKYVANTGESGVATPVASFASSLQIDSKKNGVDDDDADDDGDGDDAGEHRKRKEQLNSSSCSVMDHDEFSSKNAESEVGGVASDIGETPIRKRGRPRKYHTPQRNGSSASDSGSTPKLNYEAQSHTETPSRKRTAEIEEVTTPEIVKRKRGRPRRQTLDPKLPTATATPLAMTRRSARINRRMTK